MEGVCPHFSIQSVGHFWKEKPLYPSQYGHFFFLQGDRGRTRGSAPSYATQRSSTGAGRPKRGAVLLRQDTRCVIRLFACTRLFSVVQLYKKRGQVKHFEGGSVSCEENSPLAFFRMFLFCASVPATPVVAFN